MTPLERAIGIRNGKRSILVEIRAAERAATAKLLDLDRDLDVAKTAYGRACGSRELGEVADVAGTKRVYVDLVAQSESLENAVKELAVRLAVASADAVEAERAAIWLEVEGDKREAARYAAEALSHFEAGAKALSFWNALARKTELLAAAAGKRGQPILYDGVHGTLSKHWDDGGGILGAMRKHGIMGDFSAVSAELPPVPVLTAGSHDEGDDDPIVDEVGCMSEAGTAG